jgi:hypothetical protein
MGKTNQTVYFGKVTRTLQAKNKLEKDVLILADSILNRQLFTATELQQAIKDFKKGMANLHVQHPRCKPCLVNYDFKGYTSNTDGTIYNADLFTVTLYQVRITIDEKELTELIRQHAL